MAYNLRILPNAKLIGNLTAAWVVVFAAFRAAVKLSAAAFRYVCVARIQLRHDATEQLVTSDVSDISSLSSQLHLQSRRPNRVILPI